LEVNHRNAESGRSVLAVQESSRWAVMSRGREESEGECAQGVDVVPAHCG
jgi:hypothetical protein